MHHNNKPIWINNMRLYEPQYFPKLFLSPEMFSRNLVLTSFQKHNCFIINSGNTTVD